MLPDVGMGPQDPSVHLVDTALTDHVARRWDGRHLLDTDPEVADTVEQVRRTLVAVARAGFQHLGDWRLVDQQVRTTIELLLGQEFWFRASNVALQRHDAMLRLMVQPPKLTVQPSSEGVMLRVDPRRGPVTYTVMADTASTEDILDEMRAGHGVVLRRVPALHPDGADGHQGKQDVERAEHDGRDGGPAASALV